MSVLFTQYWEIAHDKDQEYAAFVLEQYIPRIRKLGLRTVGGYYVAIGEGPRVVSVASVDSLDNIEEILRLKDMKALQRELLEFVYDYDYKVFAPTGRFEKKGYAIQTEIWKLHQYWDLLPGKIKKYSDFIREEYLPAIEGIGLVENLGGWNMVLGRGPKIMAEFSAPDPAKIGALFENELFRKMTRRLRIEYVVHYSNSMLCPTERYGGPELTILNYF
jgi:hypothetical protein